MSSGAPLCSSLSALCPAIYQFDCNAMYLYFHLDLDLHLYLYLYFSAGSELCHPVPPSVLLYLRSALQFTNLTAMQCICICISICIWISIYISLPAVDYVTRRPLFFFIIALPCNLKMFDPVFGDQIHQTAKASIRNICRAQFKHKLLTKARLKLKI